MSHLTRLPAALAAASVLVLSASAAHATVNIPKPVINIPKPVINVPKPTFTVIKPTFTSTPISSSVRQGSFGGKPAILQNTASQWTGPAGMGSQSTTLIYRNGKVVGAISSIAKYPATTAPKPGNPATTPVNHQPNTTAANHPAPSAPAPAASQPAPAKPAAAPAAGPKITFTPVKYVAFTENGSVKGYYVNGKLVMGLTGPTGGNCSIGTAYQVLGSGTVSSNYTSGAISIPVVNCMIKS